LCLALLKLVRKPSLFADGWPAMPDKLMFLLAGRPSMHGDTGPQPGIPANPLLCGLPASG